VVSSSHSDEAAKVIKKL